MGGIQPGQVVVAGQVAVAAWNMGLAWNTHAQDTWASHASITISYILSVYAPFLCL